MVPAAVVRHDRSRRRIPAQVGPYNLTHVSSSTATLTVERIPFHGDTLEAACDGQRVWVSVRRVCDVLGLAVQPQLTKLRGKRWATITTIVTVAEDGKRREVAAINLDALPMWLATVDASRVAEQARPALERFQLEAADVLREHFLGGKRAAAAPVPAVAPEWTDEGMRLRRAELARSMANDIRPFVSPEVVAVVLAHGTAPLLGLPVETVLPALPDGLWKRPTEIAQDLGVTVHAVGRAITALALRGDADHCKTIMDKKRGSEGQVPCYLYDEHAVERIREYLAVKKAA